MFRGPVLSGGAAQAYVRGLLAPLERKNGWTLAEAAGFRSPNGLRDFVQSPARDPDLVS